MIRSRIQGWGIHLPERVVTNDELSRRIDTSDKWIRERTGIHQRHIAGDNEWTSDLAVAAAKGALENAGMAVKDIDLIIVATATPDHTFPATAAEVQRKLGSKRGAAFDMQAVCSGFVYGLTVADAMIKAGQARNVLLIGAETFSRILDWEDRGTCVLFGDGAGAFVLQATTYDEQPGKTADGPGILSSYLRSDGEYTDILYVDGGPGSNQQVGKLRMQGREVFRHAVTNIADAIRTVLRDVDLQIADIDWFVPHQANVRILTGTAKKLGIPEEKVILTVDRHANTSAASVPLAFGQGVLDGRIKRGDLVLFEAMGGGLTWGGVLARY